MSLFSSYKAGILAVVMVIVIAAIFVLKKENGESNSAPTRISLLENRPSELNMPEGGCVPDESTAVKIAEVVLLRAYGKDILEQKPFVAELVGDSVWAVSGTMPEQYLGGVAYIEIQKNNGAILGMIHGK